MDAPEFRYRLPGRAGGAMPGAHRGAGMGSGLEFIGQARLFDRPDPRRIDLRASLADLRGEWQVRAYRQLASVTVRLLADVSASMQWGSPSKQERVADFARALGRSAFRLGDPLGLVAFDGHWRDDLYVPPWRGRGAGELIAELLRRAEPGRAGAAGLLEAAGRLAGRGGLVFLASDFHWPLEGLDDVLGLLSPAHVVPLVLRDAAEIVPPARDGLARVVDSETNAQATIWLRRRLRERWQSAVRDRRAELEQVFARRGVRGFWMDAAFDAAALEHHLLEGSM